MKTAHVIVNSESGTAVSRPPDELEKLITDGLRAKGWETTFEFVPPTQVDAALKKAVKTKPDMLVIGGGDGSVRTAADAVKEEDIILGILPLGTFNAVARDLSLPLELKPAVDAIAEGHTRDIDVAEVNGRPFLGMCVMGVHADNHPESKSGTHWFFKALQMAAHTIQHLPNYRRLWLELEMDKSKHAYPTRFVAISNNPYKEQPGLAVPPHETLDGGRLVAYIGTHRTVWNVIRASIAYAAGNFKLDPNLIVEEARAIRIHSKGRKRIRLLIDGEKVVETLPLNFKLHRKQLRVAAPRLVEEEAAAQPEAIPIPAHAA